MTTEILTPDEVAVALKLPKRTVLLLCKRGEIPGAEKLGRCWRIPSWAIDHWTGRSERPVLVCEDIPNRGALVPVPEVTGVYFLKSCAPIAEGFAVKIGWAKNIAKRVRSLATAHPWPLDVVAVIPGATLADEHALHCEFDSLRLEDSPGREWFGLKGAVLDRIVDLREAMS